MMVRPMISDPFGGRSIEEWIGSSPDAKVPEKIRDRVLHRANRFCHISGRPIARGESFELEHIKPLSMGGEHRESNLAPALVKAHREKTSAEAKARAKVDRMRRKNDQTWPKSPRPIQSRGFEPGRNAR